MDKMGKIRRGEAIAGEPVQEGGIREPIRGQGKSPSHGGKGSLDIDIEKDKGLLGGTGDINEGPGHEMSICSGPSMTPPPELPRRGSGNQVRRCTGPEVGKRGFGISITNRNLPIASWKQWGGPRFKEIA